MASVRILASPRTWKRRSPSFSFSQAFTNSATTEHCFNAASPSALAVRARNAVTIGFSLVTTIERP